MRITACVCEAPIERGQHKGQPATGSPAGFRRHERAGEEPCDPCAEAERTRKIEKDRRRRAAHPEKVREQNRRYHAEHAEEIAARKRRNAEADSERVRGWGRRYRERNPGLGAQRSRGWRQRNPDKRAEQSRRRRARMGEVLTIAFTAAQLAERLSMFGNRCWMCGDPGTEVDHVIAVALSGPHCLANLRPACRPCNASKRHSDWRGYA